MRFIRVAILGLAGALMSMAAIAAPVEHAPIAVQLSSPGAKLVASVPQPNFETIHIAAKANHATASASAERTSQPAHGGRSGGDPDYNGTALGGRSHPDYNDPAFALREPGDDEGEGIGSDSIAMADPDDSDAGDEDGRMPLAA